MSDRVVIQRRGFESNLSELLSGSSSSVVVTVTGELEAARFASGFLGVSLADVELSEIEVDDPEALSGRVTVGWEFFI